MSCEGLTGLRRVWCEICEYFRQSQGIYGDAEAALFGYVQTGQRDTDAGDEATQFGESELIPRLQEYGAPSEVIDMIREAGKLSWPNNILFGNMVYLSYLQSTFRGWLGVAALPVQYQIMGELEIARPDPATAWAMARRGWSEDELSKMLNDLGWSHDLTYWLGEINRPRLSPSDVFRHMYLTGASVADAYNELGKRGYTAEDTAAMSGLSRLVPGPGDLVRMAVREAWRDDVAAEWGYDADFPPEFAEWMQKQGDVDGWAQKYWRAHWELPGLNTVLDILYRVPEFDMEDLDTFLRVSDIPATWRDYIKRTAYRPLTRVDVRRMYGMGVLDRNDVKRSYLDLGYDDANAERMTEFTIRFETEDDRAATKTDILSFLAVGAITTDEATDWLDAIGYPEDLASYLVYRELLKVEQKRGAEQVKYIRNLYIHSEITDPEASSRLAAMGIPAGEILQLLQDWRFAREAKIERPSRATLDRLLQQDVISENEYTEGLVALGYQDRYVDWYLSSVLQQKAEDAVKEEERARDEQEAIRKRRIKSDYQIAKASLDVDITEIQTAISETQLALRERQIRYREELRVAQEALTIAELQDAAARDIANLEAQIKDQESAIAFLREQVEVLETGIADIQLRGLPQPRPLTAGQAAVATREREVAIADLEVDIEAVQTEIAGIQVAISPVTIREHEVAIADLEVDIEAVQTEIAGIKLAASPEVATIDPGVADAAILERQLTIETLQDDMAALEVEISEVRLDMAKAAILEKQLEIETLQDSMAALEVEIAEIRLEQTITVADLTEEEVERQVQEHRSAIELAQDDIAGARTSIASLRSEIHQRRVQLDVDLRIVERVRSIEEIEDSWQAKLLEITLRLSELRSNLSELREQKALLAVEYRVGLAEE